MRSSSTATRGDQDREGGSLQVYDVANGKKAGTAIPRVQLRSEGGDAAWADDGSGFWYTRYPGEERPKADRSFYQQVYFHRLGSDWKNDPLVLGTAHGLPHVGIITLNSDHLRGSAIAKVQYGNGGQYAHFLLDREKAIPLAGFDDGFDAVATGPNGALYALSYANAPNGKIVRFAPPFPPSGLRGGILTVPESNVAIEHGHTMRALTLTHSHLLVREIDGGSNRVRIFGHAGEPKGTLPLPAMAAIGDIVPLANGDIVYSVLTYLQPARALHWNSRTGESKTTDIGETATYSFDDVETVQEFAATGRTKVPVVIVRRKGMAPDGSAPTILSGYGSYGVSQKPEFLRWWQRLWLDAGGIYAVAQVRGGGEFGRRWRVAGSHSRKQNSFDDFAAAARHLIDRKYTSNEKLAFSGEFGRRAAGRNGRDAKSKTRAGGGRPQRRFRHAAC